MESNEAVGQRIAKAREFLGLTQAVVAEKLGLARTTQVAIEQGRRPVSVAELYKYSEVLSRPLDYFLGLGVWGKADFRPYFRLMAEKLDASSVGPPRRPGRPKGAPEASPEKLLLMNFEALCRNYLELEETNGLPRTAMPELPVPRLFSVPEAEQLAATVRAHLDIGPDAPIRDLRVRLEDTFAIRVYVLPQRGRLSAGAFHHPAIGGSVLLAERSIPRMRFTLARALGHLLASRDEAMVDLQDAKKKAPIETFSGAFAAALLMPSRGLRERFGAVHNEANEVSDIAQAGVDGHPQAHRRGHPAGGSGRAPGAEPGAAGAARPAALGDAAGALRVPGHARLPQGADQPGPAGRVPLHHRKRHRGAPAALRGQRRRAHPGRRAGIHAHNLTPT
jgi:transcriptional regulator with XRE-family HTH domain